MGEENRYIPAFGEGWEIKFTEKDNPETYYALRKALGFPEKPILHKKLNRKSFKKALMAWGVQRNDAEKACNYIANTPFWGCGYAYYGERLYNYIWR